MEEKLILEIDAGNTSVKWRLLRDGEILCREASSYLNFFDILDALFSEYKAVSCVNVVSVAGVAFDNKLKNFIEGKGSTRLNMAEVQSVSSGVLCAYENVNQLGVDRWMAILAADHSFSGAKLVVDAGSALTIDLIDGNHRHLGGYIVPGWNLMRLALENGTQINHDRIPNDFSIEKIVPGKDTFDAIGMGRMQVMCSVIESVYSSFTDEQSMNVKLILTGGDVQRIIPHLSVDQISFIEDLVLDGLSVYFNYR